MELALLIVKVIIGFLAVMFVLALPGIMLDRFMTKRATKAITAYCSNNGLDIERVETHKNHFGLRFKTNGQKGYVKFVVGKDNAIRWVGKVPDVLHSKA